MNLSCPTQSYRLSNTNNRTENCLKISSHGFTLIELLVYIGVLLVLMSAGYMALYRYMNHSDALRRSAEDIINAVHAGENWRLDVRSAAGDIRLSTSETEQILYLPGTRGDVAYRFATNTVFRRLGDSDWLPVLEHVKASSFVPDPRSKVTAWRWDLEYQTRARRPGPVRPLFTFSAVPPNSESK